MPHPATPIAVLASISLLLGGCATTKDAVLPQDGPGIQMIYDQHFQQLGKDSALALRDGLGGRVIDTGDGDLAGYTREAFNEIDTVFPRLPNPTLVMYVFPHLAEDEGVPVPGYVTAFPMYEGVEYALPGEVPAKPGR